MNNIVAFYEAIRRGRFPVILPIEREGCVGLTTLTFSMASADAQAMALSADPRQRAKAAVFALADAADLMESKGYSLSTRTTYRS